MKRNRAAATDVAVVILTFNEERNLPQALDSVVGWAREVFVVDSGSSDRTVEIARSRECGVTVHPFENYAKQRNYALDHLPMESEWVLFLDADEWLPDDLKTEIQGLIGGDPEESGFYLKFRMIWMGRWIRRGYYPTWILRLFRRGRGRCEERPVNEHLKVEGATGYLACDFIHEDRKGIGEWIAKHNAYAQREARELLRKDGEQEEINASLWGTQAQRKRWLRYRLWNRLPPLLRPFLYFAYRYVLRGGFLDGRPAFIFHFLQALWFPFLIDIRYLELRRGREDRPGQDSQAVGS